MFFKAISLLPLIFSVWPVATASGESTTRQLPSAPARVLLFWLPMLTATFSLGFAVPQTGSGLSRCKTMSSENKPCSLTSAWAGDESAHPAIRVLRAARETIEVFICSWCEMSLNGDRNRDVGIEQVVGRLAGFKERHRAHI